ncbi:hypothetical protein LshimejAT787_0103330 [Lyophyllum shimeji]|uniref:Uncharacterized protein n=1 Tax=Lyophyllum shimeji TaxID=47721 RepID=A0A9P3PDF3_LYOSH|nr:hypothetical protein LshimejAT787_0103330 [Lyophyllum shimeji]
MENGAVVDNARDEVSAKNRFESFKFGQGLPSTVVQKHSHVRSHSRNASLSSSVSSPLPFSTSKSTNATDMSTPLNSAPPAKRNSHHRRRSSVSTRIESAEMMGVSIPDLPPSTSEDNINLGEKDSIRRRALWALEGKPDVAFSKVEIPELSTPVMERMMFDFVATKTSQPQNPVPSYGPSINTLMANKRDSFKLMGPSSSSKDQLHTLVEEEEEEEDSQEAEAVTEAAAPAAPVTPALEVTKATPARPRPANLNLRPLSLTPENLVSAVSGLPTPSLTPSPRLGLKALALVPSSTGDDVTNITNVRRSATPPSASRRLSLTLNFASESPSAAYSCSEDSKGSRRSSISYKRSSSSGNGVTTNLAGLPTPEMTPTSFDRRYSMSLDALRRRSSGSSSASGDEDSFPCHLTQSRPLSASEQHFLFKSHNALLARIQDLERALSVRRRSSGGRSTNGSSRPVSLASDFSSSSEYDNGEPSDEMLRLVADLKAERDDLKRDVDGWRTRVADMEKQLGVVAGRVETERREAWLARSMSGLLEVEKKTLQQQLADVEKSFLTLEEEKKALEKQNSEVKTRVAALEQELERVKKELEEERRAKHEASSALNQEPKTPTPRTPEPRFRPLAFAVKRGRGFTSVDSESSITDVEDSVNDSPKFDFSLKAVEEDDEDTFSEEDNGLAGYEDEEESDVSFRSSSSFDSEDDFPRSVSHLKADAPASVAPIGGAPDSAAPAVLQSPRPTHAPRASLSKIWTFPIGAQVAKQTVQQEPEVDRFFQCLQDDESDGSNSAPRSPSIFSYEKSKGLFASGFQYGADDESAPFVFPLGAGVEVESPKGLDVVQEEEEEDDASTENEDDEDMFGEAGGIQITFTPAEGDESFDSQCTSSSSPAKPSIPTIKFFDADCEEEDSAPFNFGRPLVTEPAKDAKNKPRPVVTELPKEVKEASSVMVTPPSSLPRSCEARAPSPSSIPRPTSFRPLSSSTDMTTSTPPKFATARVVSASNHSPSAFVTPPNKRGGTMPSFIPQLVSSPSPIRPKAKVASPDGTFIRQPQRKPLMLANNNATTQNVPSGAAHVDHVMNAHSLPRSSDIHAARAGPGAHPQMKSIDFSDHSSIPNNISASVSTTTHSQAYPYPFQDRNIPSSSSVATQPEASPSSFSIMSPFSARVSLQTLTNFIPISWSHRSDAPVSSSSCAGSALEVDGVRAPSEAAAKQSVPLKRAFVSKEKQLEKLRSRLERQGTLKMRTSVSVPCRRCDDEVVAL